jgi:hypothetical protein
LAAAAVAVVAAVIVPFVVLNASPGGSAGLIDQLSAAPPVLLGVMTWLYSVAKVIELLG